MPPVRKYKQGSSKNSLAQKSLEKKSVVSGQLEKKIGKQQQREDKKRGVVFLKHLPHGFFEEQLKKYFEQFGSVTRVRLGRSRRTGGSKGYAFVEFEYPEVAEVAADTMDNYLMFKKVVKAAYIPPEKQVYNYFRTTVRKVLDKAGKEIYVSHKKTAIQRKVKQMNNWSKKRYQIRTVNTLEKIEKLNKKYAHLGIDFSKVLIEPNKIAPKDNTETASKAVSLKNEQQAMFGDESNKSKKSKKSKKTLDLQDLLGNTINDDSSDEDYVASEENGDENIDESDDADDGGMDIDGAASSTDEETYGFSKDSEEEEEIENVPTGKKFKKSSNSAKSLRGPKVDRLEELIKRKPQFGAVKKAKKTQKAHKPIVAKKSVISLQVKAAKELLKAQTPKKLKSAGLKKKSAKSKNVRK